MRLKVTCERDEANKGLNRVRVLDADTGKELEGCYAVEFRASVDDLATLTVHMYASEVDIVGDAEVVEDMGTMKPGIFEVAELVDGSEPGPPTEGERHDGILSCTEKVTVDAVGAADPGNGHDIDLGSGKPNPHMPKDYIDRLNAEYPPADAGK